MTHHDIDLKKEQQASLGRPRYKYSLAARFFFLAMDLATGRKVTVAKAKLMEILACIPYRGWEALQYARLTRQYQNQELVQQSCRIVSWARDAQDNEYWQLLVINEKMKQDGLSDPWSGHTSFLHGRWRSFAPAGRFFLMHSSKTMLSMFTPSLSRIIRNGKRNRSTIHWQPNTQH